MKKKSVFGGKIPEFFPTVRHTHDTPLGRRAPLLWSDPVGARRRRAKALRRRAPLGSGVLRVAHGGSGAKAPPLAARPKSVGDSVHVFAMFSKCMHACWLCGCASVQ